MSSKENKRKTNSLLELPNVYEPKQRICPNESDEVRITMSANFDLKVEGEQPLNANK